MIDFSLAKLSLFLLLLCLTSGSFAAPLFLSESLLLNNKLYTLEIADTNNRKKRGLMYRQTLAQNAGMLFVYSKPGNYRIWMKNTMIPLSVIWLDQQLRVIGKKILQPCQTANCPVFGVSAPSKFILELNPSEFNRFKVGDILNSIGVTH